MQLHHAERRAPDLHIKSGKQNQKFGSQNSNHAIGIYKEAAIGRTGGGVEWSQESGLRSKPWEILGFAFACDIAAFGLISALEDTVKVKPLFNLRGDAAGLCFSSLVSVPAFGEPQSFNFFDSS